MRAVDRDYFIKSDELRVYLPHAQRASVVVVAALVHERAAQPLKREMRDLELVSRGRSIGATRISLLTYINIRNSGRGNTGRRHECEAPGEVFPVEGKSRGAKMPANLCTSDARGFYLRIAHFKRRCKISM